MGSTKDEKLPNELGWPGRVHKPMERNENAKDHCMQEKILDLSLKCVDTLFLPHSIVLEATFLLEK